MQHFTRLLFLMIIAFAFGACSRQTLPEATVPSVAKESEPEEESSPVATTTPVPTSSREPSTSAAALVPSPTPAPTETALPSPTPSATPLYCPEGAPADSVTTRPLRVFFVERGNLHVWDEALDTTETLVEGGAYRLYLSPDAETIAFLRQEAPGMVDASRQMALWAVDADGANERLLLDGDGLQALGPERVGDIEVGDLLIADVEDEWHVVYDSGWGPRFLGWAPDGNHFAYTVGQGANDYCGSAGSASGTSSLRDRPPGDTPATWVDGERFLYQSQSGNAGPTTLLLGTLDGPTREIGQISKRIDGYDFIEGD